MSSSVSVMNKMKKISFISLFIISIFISLQVCSAPAIKVVGLFKDKALINVDGKNKLIRKGQTYKEYTLEYADSKRAIISFNGVSKNYQLGSTGGGFQFKKAKSSAYKINANAQGMYFTNGSINGTPMDFIVDTGATMVSMNKEHALRLGINAKRDGQEIKIMTASAVVKGYKVRLKSVKVGEILIKDVDATVLMSQQPDKILLGMSFLKNLRVNQTGSVMTFEKVQ